MENRLVTKVLLILLSMGALTMADVLRPARGQNAANDLQIAQRNISNNGTLPRVMTVTTNPNEYQVIAYDSNTQRPRMITLGSEFGVASNVLGMDGMATVAHTGDYMDLSNRPTVTNGQDGADGVDGKSAYEVAVDNGFAGSQSQWLASLKGEQGEAGESIVGPKGDTGDVGPASTVLGPQGIPGNPGTAATVSVGTVTTGAAGSSATVTNAGTSSAAVLNFSIPVGATGAAGTNATTTAVATTSTNGLMAAADKTKLDALPALQRTRQQTNTSGVYTWTFPVAYGAGVTPIVQGTVESSAANSIWNVHITAVSNTQATVQLTRTTNSLVSLLGINLLQVTGTPQATIHLVAMAP